MNLYTRYYECIANLRANPQDWFIHSGNAYEAITELAKLAPMAAFELELKLKQELESLGIHLGDNGKDKYNRTVTVDWYGTYTSASEESIEFIRQKYAQYKRVNACLINQSTQERKKLSKLHCTSPKYNKVNQRIRDIDKRSYAIWACLQSYRRELAVEFKILGL